jgi:hypothetical protein
MQLGLQAGRLFLRKIHLELQAADAVLLLRKAFLCKADIPLRIEHFIT